MLPNFLIIGATKAGTTSLSTYLSRHPQVFMLIGKQLHFFTDMKMWSRGSSWYASHFAASGDAIAVGHRSTNCTKYPIYQGVAERMASLLPGVKLIYLIRDPIERIRSHYLMLVSAAAEDRPFERAVFEDPEYLATSMYGRQIEEYLPFFGREQMLIVTSEDLANNRRPIVNRVLGFVGAEGSLDAHVLQDELGRSVDLKEHSEWYRRLRGIPGYNAISRLAPASLRRSTRNLRTRPLDLDRGRMSPELRSKLVDLLYDDLLKLRGYMGEDFDCWGIA